jgi:hypothetical protein
MFLLLTMVLFSKISSKHINLCIDCKYFKKDLFTTNKYGKCTLFPINDYKYNKYYFVDGYPCRFPALNSPPPKPKQNYYFCSTIRSFDSMCGNEGKFFIKKTK